MVTAQRPFTQPRQYVVDASAVVAAIQMEPGYEVAESYFNQAIISAVNWAEVIQFFFSPNSIFNLATGRATVESKGLQVARFSRVQAQLAAMLHDRNRNDGVNLSLGDRACLSLGIVSRLPVVTAEQDWARLDIGVQVILLRS